MEVGNRKASDIAESPEIRRKLLYDDLSKQLEEKGIPSFFSGSSSSHLFHLEKKTDGTSSLTPILKPAVPPVRAIALHVKPDHAAQILQIVKEIFLPYFEGVIWLQDEMMYHCSMFQASHHLVSILASEAEIDREAEAVESIASSICPLKISLDRVVLTSSGVLLGCWQVISGMDPFLIRAKLKEALPHAPDKQLCDPAILHTSFARLSGPPNVPPNKEGERFLLQFCQQLVLSANNLLRGFQATALEMWFVEELDEFALAVDGRMKIRRFQLGGCMVC